MQIIASGDSCKNVTIYGNIISATQQAFTTNASGVYVSGFTPRLTIRKNTISSVSNAVYLIGINNLSQYTTNLVIDSNNVTTSPSGSWYGIVLNYCSNPTIKYNSILMNSCCINQGIYLSNNSNGGVIAYNKVIANSYFQYGIYLQNVNINGETTPLMVYNNFISTSSGNYNCFVSNSNYINFFNNSFNVVSSISYNLYVNSSGTNNNINIVNNSFKSPSAYISLFVGGTNITTARAMIGECNFNNYYQGSGSASENLLNLQGTNYTISTIKGAIKPSAPMSDSNSNAFNPQYKTNTDLHILPSSGLEGRGKLLSAFFTDDIDGGEAFDQQLRYRSR
ncbi:MAG: hypothetical protein IPK03_09115 [Bacteroidetes bacterium]|nr:hypothetical protein [Bacteroidota bacterium]